MNKGILIIAVGRKEYGFWAWNLAVSIKHFNDMPIQLLHDGKALSGLNKFQRSFFDHIQLIEDEDLIHSMKRGNITIKKLSPALIKTSLYKYSKFKQTLYLDADSICLQDIEPLFTSLSKQKKQYISQNQGMAKKGQKDFPQMKWASPKQAWEHFDIPNDAKLPAINSSFQYWKESKKAEDIFETARTLLNENPFDTKTSEDRWGHEYNQPDELYMNVSCAINKHDPSVKKSPVMYGFSISPMVELKDLRANDYYLISFPGDGFNLHNHYGFLYDALMSNYLRDIGQPHIYKIAYLNKSKFIRLH